MNFKWKGSLFKSLTSRFYNNLAIDLGTANTVIIKDNVIVVDEPSIIAIDRNGKLIALGHDAFIMHGKTHENIYTIKPLRDGVIANYKAAELMIRGMINMVNKDKIFLIPPIFNKLVVCVPSGITDVEKRAIKDSSEHSGARVVYMVYEPIAAAIGMGIDIFQSKAFLITDIGGGTTEVAVIILGGIISHKSIKIAGNVLTQDIIEFIRKNYNLYIGECTGEEIKIRLGAVCEDIGEDVPPPMNIYGRDTVSGIPRMITMEYKDILRSLERSIHTIEETILQVLEFTPPELASDLYDNGIILTGGGAMLRGLPTRLSRLTQLNVHIADEPLKSVVYGTSVILNDLEKYKSILMI